MKINLSVMGGRLKDQPKPIVRKFDNKKRKRKVTVHVMTYVGTCVWYAKHYTGVIREEDNPILGKDDGQPAWITCWDDAKAKGQIIFGPCTESEHEAWFWIKSTVKEKFPKHKVEFEYPEDKKKLTME